MKKKGELRQEFDNTTNQIANDAIRTANDARQVETVVRGLQNPFVPHVLLFRAIEKLVDIIDEEMSNENPSPVVTGISNGINSISKFVDDTKATITNKFSNSSNIQNQLTDTQTGFSSPPVEKDVLLSGKEAGDDFYDVHHTW